MGSIEGEKKTFKNTEDSEDESEVLEESPCGRWLKRREVVQQRDVPGIDAAYLAMDTEEGVEVVWNEVFFSERKNLRAQEEKISLVFDNLIKLEHPNIVKFHKYWIDSREEKPRVIFITEYMSSGSLKQFLKRTKRNVKKPSLQAWKRWCTQILSALSFLHSCSPPIVHGNLTCDTIFIQHNGLIKIGSGKNNVNRFFCTAVAPDAIHQHVKTCREGMKNTHFIAPEYGTIITPAVDIYSFGVCALEMATLEIHGSIGETGSVVTVEHLQRAIEGLEVTIQSDFIHACLKKEPELRLTASQLLFHRALFEVSSLKLLAAHIVVRCSANISETICDKVIQQHYGPGVVVAEARYSSGSNVQFTMADIAVTEKLEKFVEDVKYGIYPLTVFASDVVDTVSQRPISPDVSLPTITESPVSEQNDIEARRITSIVCDVKEKSDGTGFQLVLLLRMDDRMNRQLSGAIQKDERAADCAEELIFYGLINNIDRDLVASTVEDSISICISRNERDCCYSEDFELSSSHEPSSASPVN